MTLRCPRCRQQNVRRSHRKVFERLLQYIGLVPYRCQSCQCRFLWFRQKEQLNSGPTHG